jgi:hypothetical protein
MTDFQKHQATLEFLSNLVPYSVDYNKTVQSLRRNKRHANAEQEPHHTNHTRREHHTLPPGYAIRYASHNATLAAQKKLLHRINREWDNKLREKLHQKLLLKTNNYPSEIKIAHLVMSSPKPGATECGGELKQYAWMLIFTYLVFCGALFNFLVLSESAVFTVTIITASLPLTGIFWSLFEMTTTANHVGECVTHFFVAFSFVFCFFNDSIQFSQTSEWGNISSFYIDVYIFIQYKSAHFDVL